MKRLIVAVMLIVGTAFSVLGQEQKAKLTTCPAGWTAGPDADWKIFWNDALTEARQTGKKIFVLSTGSDWCGWCMKLKKDVFEKDEFKDYARKKLVLLYLDSPRKPLPEDQKQHNDAICGTLSFGGGVPCAAVFGVDSRRYGVISGYSKTPAEYIARIDEVLAKEGEMPKSGQPPRIFTEGYADSGRAANEEKVLGEKSQAELKRLAAEVRAKKLAEEKKTCAKRDVGKKVTNNGLKGQWTEPQTGIVWHYEINNGMATILRIKTPSQFDGHVSVPEYIEGNLVTCIRALSPDVVSLKVPEGVGGFGGTGTSVPWMPRLELLSLPASWRDDKSFEILSSTLKTVTINPSNENFTVVGELVCDKKMERVVFCPGGVEEVVLPKDVEDVSGLFRYTGKLRRIRVAPGSCCFEARDGVLYDKDMSTLVRCPNVREKIVIPPSVKAIGARAFCGCKTLSEVRIPDTVTEVDSWAFASCTGLCAVVLSKNLTGISSFMFSRCTSLKSITLPQSIREIGWGAFADCSSLQSVRVNGSEEERCVEGRTVRVNGAAFLQCGNLTSVDLPGSDVQIFREPFEGCSNLTELAFLPRMQGLRTSILKGTRYYRVMSNGAPIVFHSRLMGIKDPVPSLLEIPSGVVEVAGHAFSGNKDLKSVVIPATVTNIGSRAFSSCGQLETVTLLPLVMSVCSDAFSDCPSLKCIVTPTDNTNRLARIEQAIGRKVRVSESGKLTVLPKQEGEKTKLAEAKKERTKHDTEKKVTNGGLTGPLVLKRASANAGEIPDNYNSEEADYSPTSKTSTKCSREKISMARKRLAEEASARRRALTEYTHEGATFRFQRSLDGVEITGFPDRNYNGEVAIPDEIHGIPVVSIGANAFKGREWITHVTLPKGIKSIKANAFAYCRRLTSFVIPDGALDIGEYAFYGCDQLVPTRIFVPPSVKRIGLSAFDSGHYISRSRPILQEHVEVIDGLRWHYVQFAEGAEIVKVEVVKGERGNGRGEVVLSSHIKGKSVLSIGKSAFEGLEEVESITLPKTVERIGERAFYGCKKLKKLNLPDGITLIGKMAFRNCESLLGVKLPRDLLFVEDGLLQHCFALQSVTLGENLMGVGADAFLSCREPSRNHSSGWAEVHWIVCV